MMIANKCALLRGIPTYGATIRAGRLQSAGERFLSQTHTTGSGRTVEVRTGPGGNGFAALNPPDPSSIPGGERDFIGYAGDWPDPKWPKGAKLALNFVINYEEGSEASLFFGDNITETVLTDGARDFGPGKRNMGAESLFEYGSRVGFWRLMKMFEAREMPCTIYACAMALEGHPKAAEYIRSSSPRVDVCCHGWRWWRQDNLPEEEEREHIRLAVASLKQTLGVDSTQYLGWYGRYAPSINTRRLLVEQGFAYDSDAYNDDLPYWTTVEGRPHLVVPYSIQNNDVHLAYGNLGTGAHFYESMADAIDLLVEEGNAGSPKMMTVGLHMRLVGSPKYAKSIARLLDYAQSFGDDVWVTTRSSIAKHWWDVNPGGLRPQ